MVCVKWLSVTLLLRVIDAFRIEIRSSYQHTRVVYHCCCCPTCCCYYYYYHYYHYYYYYYYYYYHYYYDCKLI